MKLGFKGLAAVLGSVVLMSAMAATPASACKAKKAHGWKAAPAPMTKVFGWKKRKCMKAKWRHKKKCARYL